MKSSSFCHSHFPLPESEYKVAKQQHDHQCYTATQRTKQKYFFPNPVTELEMPKLPARHARYLEWDEAVDLLKGITGRHKERDFAIVTLFLNCGMRLSELTQIKITDIKNDALRIIGKGNKERTVFLNHACLKAINRYLAVRQESDSPYLFLSQQNTPISNKGKYTKPCFDKGMPAYSINCDGT